MKGAEIVHDRSSNDLRRRRNGGGGSVTHTPK